MVSARPEVASSRAWQHHSRAATVGSGGPKMGRTPGVRPQGPGKVLFQLVSAYVMARSGWRERCLVAVAISLVPARRSRLSAVLRRVAMTRGAAPVRT